MFFYQIVRNVQKLVLDSVRTVKTWRKPVRQVSLKENVGRNTRERRICFACVWHFREIPCDDIPFFEIPSLAFPFTRFTTPDIAVNMLFFFFVSALRLYKLNIKDASTRGNRVSLFILFIFFFFFFCCFFNLKFLSNEQTMVYLEFMYIYICNNNNNNS